MLILSEKFRIRIHFCALIGVQMGGNIRIRIQKQRIWIHNTGLSDFGPSLKDTNELKISANLTQNFY